MKKKLLISFSGGRTSAYMTWWLLKEYYKAEWNEETQTHIGIDSKTKEEIEIIVVFSNTGKEREETLEFVRQCDYHFGFHTVWIESETNPKNNYGVKARVVSFYTANRTGNPFEEVIKKHGLPNQETPHCSRQMKGEAIKAYARSIGWRGKKYQTAIGIRSDEQQRLNWKTAKKNNLIYPFATMITVNKGDVNRFWSNQVFDLELKSYEGNCDLCWKKSKRKLMTLVTEHPEYIDWWKRMEDEYGNYVPEHRSKSTITLPLRMYRENETITEIAEEAALGFIPAKDESKIVHPKAADMFGWDGYLDSNSGCVESCEAF